MAMHLVRRNARSVPWITEETLAPIRRQNSTDHDIGPRTSKPSSPSEVPDSRILRGYYGAKGSRCPGPFQILSPKSQAEEENARRGKCPRMTKEGPKLLGEIAEDRHVLGELVP